MLTLWLRPGWHWPTERVYNIHCFALTSMSLSLSLVFMNADPRVKDWSMMESPLPTMAMCAFYAYFSKSLGPKLMANRKPMDLRLVLVVYNLFQTVFSTWIFYEVSLLINTFCIQHENRIRATMNHGMSGVICGLKVQCGIANESKQTQKNVQLTHRWDRWRTEIARLISSELCQNDCNISPFNAIMYADNERRPALKTLIIRRLCVITCFVWYALIWRFD